jgi:hypothetical protein
VGGKYSLVNFIGKLGKIFIGKYSLGKIFIVEIFIGKYSLVENIHWWGQCSLVNIKYSLVNIHWWKIFIGGDNVHW